MEQLLTYILLFSIIIIVGLVSNKLIIPITLLLVIVGMILSFIPQFPKISIDPNLILHIFLPLLIYQISSFSSWFDFKKNIRPIALLSIGHVVFITFTVAYIVHGLIPDLGWPLCFVLGAVVSPPDDVAIVSIAQKIRFPNRVITILEGEGLLNDAAALTLFRFSIAALLTQQFSAAQTLLNFLIIVVGEILYGFLIGELLGQIRKRIKNTSLHMMASLLTPFFAYLPPLILGGSGVISTVATGFVIGHRYVTYFTPEFRLVGFAIWPMISFAINCLIFLLVGLNLRSIIDSIAPLSFNSILVYGSIIIFTVIVARFIWVFIAQVFLPRFLFPSILKKDPYPPWQFPFLISWSGMRGPISLAAALAIPILPNLGNGPNPRDLIIFFVFMLILATFLLQGLTLPWIMKVLNVKQIGEKEAYREHVNELLARKAMIKAALRWLKQYRREYNEDKLLCSQLKLAITEYRDHLADLKNRIDHHPEELEYESEANSNEENRLDIFLKTQLIEVERATLFQLWRRAKVSLTLRNKLLEKLDHRIKHLPG